MYISPITKVVERVVVGEAEVTVCDVCGRESTATSAVTFGTWPPDGWYVIALVPGIRKEACSEACAIQLVYSLRMVPSA